MQKGKKQADKNKPEAIFWTARKVAAFCDCSVGAVWGWKRKGVLNAYGQGRVVRFKASDVERLMAQPK